MHVAARSCKVSSHHPLTPKQCATWPCSRAGLPQLQFFITCSICKRSKTGGYMQAIKDWRLYACDQKLEAVCKRSKTGGGEGLHDAMWYLHWCLAVAYCKRCKHYLCNVEGMPPVVIGHRTVILLHRQQPPVKHLCTCEWGKCILIKCTKTVKQLIQVHTHCIAIH